MLNFDGKTVLVTGGTGSFGKAFIANLLKCYPNVKKVIVFSRDELKQSEMLASIAHEFKAKVRFFLGDVRDQSRLIVALHKVDYLIHAAALKQVPAAEYNPFEFIKTNILGAQNIIEASLQTGVKKVVALSTDKACAPVNLYGATKLCSDKLFVAANNMFGDRDISFVVVRYGNVVGSRGSVLPVFLEARKSGLLRLTDPEMTRFSISLEDGVKTVMESIEEGEGGEIFVPKLPSYRLKDFANAVGASCRIEIIGRRPGEKRHEVMISNEEATHVVDVGSKFIILPSSYTDIQVENYCERKLGERVSVNFNYDSGTNTDFLSVDELGKIAESYDAN